MMSTTEPGPLAGLLTAGDRAQLAGLAVAYDEGVDADLLLVIEAAGDGPAARRLAELRKAVAANGAPGLAFPLELDAYLPLAIALDILRAKTWDTAFSLALPAESDAVWSELEARALERGDDEAARRVRRHGAAVARAREIGPVRAAAELAEAPDLREPKDRAAWLRVLNEVITDDVEQIDAAVRKHPGLLTDDAAALIRDVAGRVLGEFNPWLALMIEDRQLLLDRVRRLGPAGIDRAPDAARDARAGALCALADAAIARCDNGGGIRDLDEALGARSEALRLVIRQTGRDGTGLEELRLGNDVRAVLLRRHELSGSAFDLQLALIFGALQMAALPAATPPELEVALRRTMVAALTGAMNLFGERTLLPELIEHCERLVELSPEQTPERATAQGELLSAVVAQYEHTGDPAVLVRAQGVQRDLAALPAVGWDERLARGRLAATVLLYLSRHDASGDAADAFSAVLLDLRAAPSQVDPEVVVHASQLTLVLARAGVADAATAGLAVELSQIAVDRSRSSGTPAALLNDLALALLRSHQVIGDATHLARAEECAAEAVRAAGRQGLDAAPFQNVRGNVWQRRYAATGDLADLDQAIALYDAVAHGATGDTELMARANLGTSLQMRYDATRSPADLDRAVEVVEGTLARTPEDDEFLLNRTSALAGVLRMRATTRQAAGDVDGAAEDAERGIALLRTAIARSDDADAAAPFAWMNLALALAGRYGLTRERVDLDESATFLRRTLLRLSGTSPHLGVVVQNFVAVSAQILAHDHGLDVADPGWTYALDQGELLRSLRTGDDPQAVLDRAWQRWVQLAAEHRSEVTAPAAPDDADTSPADQAGLPVTVRLQLAQPGPLRLDLPGPLTGLMRRIRDEPDEPDPAADLAVWRTVFAHPMFPLVDLPTRQRMLLWGATTAFFHYAQAPDLVRLDAWRDVLRLLADLLESDHPWWASVVVECSRLTAMRYEYTADAHDLNVAFDQLAGVADARPVDDPERLDCLEYLAGVLSSYGAAVQATASGQRRVRRLDDLLETGPADQDGVRWTPVRVALLRGYAADVTDRDQLRRNLRRSLEIAEAGRPALGLEDFESWDRLIAGIRGRLAAVDAEDSVGEQVDVGAAMAAAGDRSDPEAARRRVQVLRMAVPHVDGSDRFTWFAVRGSLVVDLMRLQSGSRAANLDEAIAVAEEMAAGVTTGDPEDLRTLPFVLLADLYSLRVTGDPRENAERMLRHCRRQVELAAPGSAAWARGLLHVANALTEQVGLDRSAAFEDALRFCGQAAAAADALGSAELRADAQYVLGRVYRDRIVGNPVDNIEQAIAANTACLRHRTRESNGEHWANAHHNLGGAYQARLVGDRQENLVRAIHHYEQELLFFDRNGWPDDWATAQISLGDAYSQSLRPSAQESMQRAIAAYENARAVLTPQDQPSEWWRVHNSLGIVLLDGDNVHGRARDPQRALECLEEALRVARPGLPERAYVLINLVGALTLLAVQRDGRDGQRALLERAMTAATEATAALDRSTDPLPWARAQSGRAQCALLLADIGVDADLAAGRNALREAVAVFRENGVLPDAWAAAVGLIMLSRRTGEWSQAVRAYGRAAEIHQELYEMSLLQDARAAELARGRTLLEAGLPALLAAGDLVGAVVAVERMRARWLGEILARDRIDLDRLGREHPPLRTAYAVAAQALTSAESQERRAAIAGEGDGSLVGVVEEARAGFVAALARIRRVSGYRRFLALPDIDDISVAVRPEAPLVYVVPTDETCHLLMVHQRTGGEIGVHREEASELTLGRIDAMLLGHDDGSTSYLTRQLTGARDFAAALTTILPELGRLLLPPLRRGLEELRATGVTLVLGGRLALLPVHAAAHPDDGARLLDDLDVRYLPSAWVRDRRDDDEAQHPAPALVAVGDPTEDLPYARAEIEEIALLFDPRTSAVRYGPAATVAAVTPDLPGARYVHLACHGYYDVGNPLDSHLRLASGERLSLRELLDGRMFADVRLVVASACQTAVAEFRTLPDEAIGLPAGFLRAGARAVIGTLWPVSDLSTALLMMRFYRLHLGGNGEPGMSPSRALRTAQRWLSTVTAGELVQLFGGHVALRAAVASRLPADVAAAGAIRFGLDDPDARPFAHPYFWAPFQLTGE